MGYLLNTVNRLDLLEAGFLPTDSTRLTIASLSDGDAYKSRHSEVIEVKISESI